MLERVVRWLALLGGAIVLAVVAMTVVSVIGRYFFSLPVRGDFEITELACGVAAFLFFPYTQIQGQNLIADFFSAKMSPRRRTLLDAIHTLIFAAVAAFFGWRLFEGMLDKYASHAKSMLIGIPIWWGYLIAAPASLVLAAVCLWGAWRSFTDRAEANESH